MYNNSFKILIACIVLLSSSMAKAQGNLPYIDDRKLHFGFTLGFNTMGFGVTPSFMEQDGEIYDVSISSLAPGFSVGVITDLRLSNYFNLRLVPSLNFGERTLSYKAQNGTEIRSTSIPSIPINVPVYLKYSSQRTGNIRPYLLGGAGAYADLGRDAEKPVFLNLLDYYIEFGVGCDIYFPFFKFAPELKFAIGFNDMLVPLDERNSGSIKNEDKIFTTSISKLTSKMLTLTFNFE